MDTADDLAMWQCVLWQQQGDHDMTAGGSYDGAPESGQGVQGHAGQMDYDDNLTSPSHDNVIGSTDISTHAIDLLLEIPDQSLSAQLDTSDSNMEVHSTLAAEEYELEKHLMDYERMNGGGKYIESILKLRCHLNGIRNLKIAQGVTIFHDLVLHEACTKQCEDKYAKKQALHIPGRHTTPGCQQDWRADIAHPQKFDQYTILLQNTERSNRCMTRNETRRLQSSMCPVESKRGKGANTNAGVRKESKILPQRLKSTLRKEAGRAKKSATQAALEVYKGERMVKEETDVDSGDAFDFNDMKMSLAIRQRPKEIMQQQFGEAIARSSTDVEIKTEMEMEDA